MRGRRGGNVPRSERKKPAEKRVVLLAPDLISIGLGKGGGAELQPLRCARGERRFVCVRVCVGRGGVMLCWRNSENICGGWEGGAAVAEGGGAPRSAPAEGFYLYYLYRNIYGTLRSQPGKGAPESCSRQGGMRRRAETEREGWARGSE